jgi:hypothetical protein
MTLSQDVVLPKSRQRPDAIYVATDYMYYDMPYKDIQYITNCIIDNYNPNLEIVYDVEGEGLPYYILIWLDKITRTLIANNIDLNSITLLSGGHNGEENQILYLKLCEKFNFIPVKIKFTNIYEQHAIRYLNLYPEIYNSEVSVPRLKPKKFLCLNRTVKVHRISLVAELMRRNLVDDAYVSMYVNGSDEDGCVGSFGIPYHNISKQLPKYHESISNYLKENEHRFPLKLTLEKDPTNTFDMSKEQYLFDDSYFGIITETKYFSDSDDIDLIKSDLTLDCSFFTEKTYKFILAKHPFILVGFRRSLAKLREQGYKTFSPYIDESYDTIENDEDRLMAIADEIERLSKFTDEEWLEFQRHTIPIIEHNFKVFASK